MGFDVALNLVPGLLTGSDPGIAYAQSFIDAGASEVWRLTDILSGTTIPAYVSSARNGTLQGWTLQAGTSPVTGEALKTPFSDGANDYGNIQSASLASLFNGAEGGVFGWSQVTGASVWTDAAIRFVFYLEVDANNFIRIRKVNTNNTFDFRYRAGGTIDDVTQSSFSPTANFSWALTWSKSADELIGYINGAPVGAAQTGLGTWAGVPAITLLGASSMVPANVWDGYFSYIALWAGARPSGATIAALHAGVS